MKIETIDVEVGGAGKASGDTGDSGGEGTGSLPPFDEPNREVARLGIVSWFVILTVMMTFVILFAAYVVISTNRAMEWKPFALPGQIWISSVLIGFSSISLEISLQSLKRRLITWMKRGLVSTAALGAAFVASQAICWLELVNRGYTLEGNPYAGFFYFLTVLHALHVTGGLIWLGYATLISFSFDVTKVPARAIAVTQGATRYWHFMGVLWVSIVLLLGFWK